MQRGMNGTSDTRLYYATRDGQSLRIASRIADRLAESGIAAPPHDLADAVPTAAELAASRLIVVVAAVRYGRHLLQAERFFAAYRAAGAPAPLVFVSVNLTARKPGKETADGNPYLRKSIARHGLAPVLATAVAGRLDYPRYRWFDRQAIRLIMKMTGGPTDPRSTTEFTAWDMVDRFAAQIADLTGGGASEGKTVEGRAN